ncbi:MAG: HIRAN domain-containing protein [Thiohalomonadales bacterium]
MNVIFIAWQDPESRQWAPVGRLSKENSEFSFVYTQGAEEVPNFTPFGRMKDLHAIYKSDTLFPLFSNRVLPKSRPEYSDYMNWLGLNESNYDEMEELSRTAGLRATDSLELFPCPLPTSQNIYELFFFSRGLRHMYSENQERANNLKEGEQLFLMQDFQNSYDGMALMMRTNDPVSLVGYTPRYYSGEVSELIKSNKPENIVVTVEKVNQNAPLQYRVLCKLKTKWPANFMPCSDAQYKALA